MSEPVVGKYYKHFKGNAYQVIAIGKHHESGEVMVTYQNLNTGECHVRELASWQSRTKNKLERFRLVEKETLAKILLSL